jgi:hypothetical protein
MAEDLREIEWTVHSDLVTRYANRLLKESDLAKLINSSERRFDLLVSSIGETLYPYGRVWVGREVSHIEPPSNKEHAGLKSALTTLSSSSRYLSLHLFDVLDHRRPAIISVIAGDCGPEAAPVDAETYVEVQNLYQRLSAEAPAEMPTLVKWIQRSLSDECARHNLALQLSFGQHDVPPHDLFSGFWRHVEFPGRYCRAVYAIEPALKKCAAGGRTQIAPGEVSSAIARAARECRSSPDLDDLERFASQMGDTVNVALSTEDAALIALSFYLWECSIGIMPYYFRGVAWNLPHFEKSNGADAPLPAFLAISCTSNAPLGAKEMDILDALTRGIASAVTVCGIELAQKVMSHAYIPSMLKHEVGNGLSHLTNRLRQFSKAAGVPEGVQAFHNSVRAEINYLQWLIQEVMDSPDPDREPAKVIYDEVESMWADLFSQMILRGKPVMDNVTLLVRTGSDEHKLGLSKESVGRLAGLRWPPPVAINRNRMRQLLAILVTNALRCDGVSKVEIRLAWDEPVPTYLHLTVWDDGAPYLPSADPGQRVRYGHKLIKRSMKALAKRYGRAAFTPPELGAVGEDKIFSLTLPVSRAPYEG